MGGHRKFWVLSWGVFHKERQARGLLLPPYSKEIALHNVSYKGQAQLNNVAFMTH